MIINDAQVCHCTYNWETEIEESKELRHPRILLQYSLISSYNFTQYGIMSCVTFWVQRLRWKPSYFGMSKMLYAIMHVMFYENYFLCSAMNAHSLIVHVHVPGLIDNLPLHDSGWAETTFSCSHPFGCWVTTHLEPVVFTITHTCNTHAMNLHHLKVLPFWARIHGCTFMSSDLQTCTYMCLSVSCVLAEIPCNANRWICHLTGCCKNVCLVAHCLPQTGVYTYQ